MSPAPAEELTDVGLGGRQWVGYLTPLPFPWGSAGSRRILGVAQSLLQLGFDVVVLSGSEPRAARVVHTHPSGSRIVVVGTPDFHGGFGWLGRQVSQHLLGGREALSWIRAQPSPPRHLIVYGGGTSYAVRTLAAVRRIGATAVADVVEWYAPRQFAGGILAPAWLSAQVALRWIYPRFDAVMVISSYLKAQYRAAGRCEIVPPTLDVARLNQSQSGHDVSRSGPVKFCYFGSPGRKDLLPEIVEGFVLARGATPGARMTLEIVGPDVAEVERCLGAALPDGVSVVDRLAQDQVSSFVRRRDYSLLLRPVAAYSMAGFPTKFVESLACGTPVIANHTSDLAEYLHDGVNGFVVEAATSAAMADAIRRAMEVDARARVAMRREASATAARSFDFRSNTRQLARLLTGPLDV